MTSLPVNDARRPIPFWGVLTIVLVTVTAYWPVFSAGFIWDDDVYVINNPLLTAPDGWWRIWFSAHAQSQYFPLVYSTLRLEYDLWGLHSAGYHLVNVCWHIANVLLVWKLLCRLALPGAWFTAAIWAVHPVQVETVAWVTELKNTESTFFYLFGLSLWLDFANTNHKKFYILAFFLFALALFAKTTACTFPAVALLLLWLRGEAISQKRILQISPFFAAGLMMGLLSIWWEKHLGNYQARYHLPAGLAERVLLASHALWFYAGKIFWPSDLTFSYPQWEINGEDWVQYLWLMAGVTTAVGAWAARRRFGRGPAAAMFFFAIVLSPMLGFISLYTFYYSYVADHYQYLACLGLMTLFTNISIRWFEKNQVTAKWRALGGGALLGILVMLTWRQSHIYKDVKTVWSDTVNKNPLSWMAHANLGWLLARDGDYRGAEFHYRQAIAISPENADIHRYFGDVLTRESKFDSAIAEYKRCLQLDPGLTPAKIRLRELQPSAK